MRWSLLRIPAFRALWVGRLLSWVVGGFIGIALPLKIGGEVLPQLGLGVLAVLMVSWTALVLLRRQPQVSAR